MFRHLQKLLVVKALGTTPYHPITNDSVDRINSTMIQMLKLLSESCKARWMTAGFCYWIQFILLMFIRNSILPTDILLEVRDYEKEHSYLKHVE